MFFLRQSCPWSSQGWLCWLWQEPRTKNEFLLLNYLSLIPFLENSQAHLGGKANKLEGFILTPWAENVGESTIGVLVDGGIVSWLRHHKDTQSRQDQSPDTIHKDQELRVFEFRMNIGIVPIIILQVEEIFLNNIISYQNISDYWCLAEHITLVIIFSWRIPHVRYETWSPTKQNIRIPPLLHMDWASCSEVGSLLRSVNPWVSCPTTQALTVFWRQLPLSPGEYNAIKNIIGCRLCKLSRPKTAGTYWNSQHQGITKIPHSRETLPPWRNEDFSSHLIRKYPGTRIDI